jgi:hypothetical protein
MGESDVRTLNQSKQTMRAENAGCHILRRSLAEM